MCSAHRRIGIVPFGIDYTGYSNFPLGAKEHRRGHRRVRAAVSVAGPDGARVGAPEFQKRVWGGGEPDDRSTRKLDLGRWTATLAFNEWQFGMKEWFPAIERQCPSGRLIPRAAHCWPSSGPMNSCSTGQRVRVNFAPAAKVARRTASSSRAWKRASTATASGSAAAIWNGDQTDYGLNLTDEPRVLKVRLATY